MFSRRTGWPCSPIAKGPLTWSSLPWTVPGSAESFCSLAACLWPAFPGSGKPWSVQTLAWTEGQRWGEAPGETRLRRLGGGRWRSTRLHQTEVSPIYFQEGAPLTQAFGGKNKNTNHHSKCTCYFPSGVRNWIASESRENAADGLGLELGSPHAGGRDAETWHGSRPA